jgi:hypothetical protein
MRLRTLRARLDRLGTPAAEPTPASIQEDLAKTRLLELGLRESSPRRAPLTEAKKPSLLNWKPASRPTLTTRLRMRLRPRKPEIGADCRRRNYISIALRTCTRLSSLWHLVCQNSSRIYGRK